MLDVESHLVSRSELGPRFVCPPVVVVGVGALDVLVEAQDLPRLELSHRGSLRQLAARTNRSVVK